MKRLVTLLVISFALFAPSTFAAQSKKDKELEAQQQAMVDSLRREVEALKKIRAEKLDKIEELETKRWEERYRENQQVQEHQEAVRSLDGRYTKSSTDLGRLNDELVQAKNATEEMKTKAEEAKQSLAELSMQVQQTVEKSSNDLSADYPVDLETRNLYFSKAREALAGGPQASGKALGIYFDALANRYALTLSQEFKSRNSQLGDKAEVPVYRLRLGTVFLAEIARADKTAQTLQRTGAVQGRVYEWRADLSDAFGKEVHEAVLSAQQGHSDAWIPLDVLQTKNVQATTRKNQQASFKEKVQETFHSGGPIMYPLAGLALIALLFSLERWLTFIRRGRISKKLVEQVNRMVELKQYREASAYCRGDGSALGAVLSSILDHAEDGNRTNAEKAVRQTLMREQPLLERRMGMLGALGTAAPLLGLLGTVGGMIALFTVLTDVGTNDAKMLAGGIAEALVCTETGLIIAIPVLLLHGWLTEKLDVITSSLSFQSMALLNHLWPEGEEGEG